MSISVCYDKEHNCLVGTLKGKMDRATIQAYSEEVMKVASRHTCGKLLTDMLEAEVDISTGELYFLPSMLDDAGLDQSWQRAIVMSKQHEQYEFYERVSRIQGFTVKIFSEPEQALSWLAANDNT